MNILKSKQVRHALMIGAISALSYWACYFARNILGVMTPQIVEKTSITVEFIGTLSTANMLSYAVGQLVNGIIGDKVKAKYLVSGGLCFAGIGIAVVGKASSDIVMMIAYSLVGFFLSMLYAPLVKLISENTYPTHAIRCCLGLSFASLLGAPTAGAVALIFDWKSAFAVCGMTIALIGAVFFLAVHSFEKHGVVKYRERKIAKEKNRGVRALMEHEIVKYSFVSVLTGIVRTSVVFWIPTYLSQYLGFSAGISATIFTVMSCAQAASPYINNLLFYERVLKRNRNAALLFSFTMSAMGFAMMFIVKNPIVNIVFIIVALVMNSGAADLLWSVYCPSLRETGMVSSATGYLDFLSYMAAAVANLLFANAISIIGWGKLILVWAGLMSAGAMISLPWKNLNSIAEKRKNH